MKIYKPEGTYNNKFNGSTKGYSSYIGIAEDCNKAWCQFIDK